MSDTNTNGENERTNLAPILAPIITLFIGFGAGVVFSEFIPLGKTAPIQQNPNVAPATGPRDEGAGRTRPDQPDVDAEIEQTLEEGEEAANDALEGATRNDDGG